jgi:hypothetical protein
MLGVSTSTVSISAFGFSERKGANVTPLELGGGLVLGGLGGGGAAGGAYNMWADHFSQLSTGAGAGAVGASTGGPGAGVGGGGSGVVGVNAGVGIGLGVGAVGQPPGAARGSPARLNAINGGGSISPAGVSPVGLGGGSGGKATGGGNPGATFTTGGLPSFFGLASAAAVAGSVSGESDALEPLESAVGGGGLGGRVPAAAGGWGEWAGGGIRASPSATELALDTAEWAENNKDLLDGLDLD